MTNPLAWTERASRTFYRIPRAAGVRTRRTTLWAGLVVLLLLSTVPALGAPAARSAPPPLPSPGAANAAHSGQQLAAAQASLADRTVRLASDRPSAGSAGSQWTELNNSSAPPGRASGAFAYDPLLHVVVLFGGYLPAVATIGDTWEFANDSWTNVSGSVGTAPPARWEAGFAYDPAIGALVLFGGRNLTQFFNDTWTFNSTGWHQLTGAWQNNPFQHPAALGLVSMAWDPAENAIALFGGGTGNVPAGSYNAWTYSNWTWLFNGTNTTDPWQNIYGVYYSSLTPPAVAGAGFAYDAYSGRMILLGGSDAASGCGQVASEYALNGTTWVNLTNQTPLPYGNEGFFNGGMVDDTALGGILLYGGVILGGGSCPSGSATWLYRNGTWTNLTASLYGTPAPPSWWFQLAYDADSGQAVVCTDFTYGSYYYAGQVWVLNSTPSFWAAAYATPPSGYAPLAVNFTGLPYGGVSPFNYTWRFYNASNQSGPYSIAFGQNICCGQSIVYGSPGVYLTTLAVRDATNATTNASVYVTVFSATGNNSSLSAAINASPTQGAAPVVVNFTGLATGGTPPYSFGWAFGDGGTSAAGNVTHTYSSAGAYVATLTVVDANGTSASASVSITAGSAGTAGNWSQVATAYGPSQRSAAFMAYDPALSEVVLFGGYTGPAVSDIGDTWAYANGSWTLLNVSTGPSPRWEGGLVYDPSLSELVLFGGRNLTQFFNDTWAFTSTGWSRIATTVAPSARGLFGMTYDPNVDAIVLYGGGTGNLPAGMYNGWTVDNDTWEFTSAGWTHVATVGPSPPALTSPGFAYDPGHHADVLYGGTTAPNGCAPIAEQWAFANSTWTNETNASSAPGGSHGLLNMGFVEDPTGGGLLVFGGITTYGGGVCVSTSETWGERNGTWTNLTSSVGSIVPVSRQAFPMTYDAADGVDLLFGGATFGTYNYLGDTWAFRASPLQLAPIHAHGSASSTSGTVPLAVSFDVTVGPGVIIAQTAWEFGDGASAVGGASVSHVYVKAGAFNASVTVTTSDGRSVIVPLGTIRTMAPANVVPPSLTPGIGPGSPLFGYSDLAGLAVGVLAAVGLWVALDYRRRRLRDEGLDLLRGIQPPPPDPPTP